VFYFNAALGVVWAIVWALYARNNPADHPKISKEELEEIEQHRASRPSSPVSPWAVLKSSQVLLLSASYMCLVFGVWMIILWLPTYLVRGRGFSVVQMGWIGMIPTLASFLGLVGGGVMSDKLLKRGFSPRFSRAQGPALCIGIGVPFLVFAVLLPWGWASVACFALYLFTINLSTGGYWSVPLAFNPRLVGAISGVMTCAGNLGGVFAPMTAGYIFTATGSWALPFLVAAGFAVVAFVIYYFLVIPQPISFEAETPDSLAVERVATEAGAHE
ncbi:MAG TPA: MFS transporter, partial [Blastocatellia bacterium]|nr:MFS transporter [Blastocatellia bacterium]